MHYLDHAATTPVPAPVAQAMLEVLTHQYGNPSAQYPLGQEARQLVERCRATVAHMGCTAGVYRRRGSHFFCAPVHRGYRRSGGLYHLEEIELEIVRLLHAPEDGMVTALLPCLDLPQLHTGVPGGGAEHFQKFFLCGEV